MSKLLNIFQCCINPRSLKAINCSNCINSCLAFTAFNHHPVSVCMSLRSSVCNLYRHGCHGREQWRNMLWKIWLRLPQSQVLSWDGEGTEHTHALSNVKTDTGYVHKHGGIFYPTVFILFIQDSINVCESLTETKTWYRLLRAFALFELEVCGKIPQTNEKLLLLDFGYCRFETLIVYLQQMSLQNKVHGEISFQLILVGDFIPFLSYYSWHVFKLSLQLLKSTTLE